MVYVIIGTIIILSLCVPEMDITSWLVKHLVVNFKTCDIEYKTTVSPCVC